jgi:hypothetical protein
MPAQILPFPVASTPSGAASPLAFFMRIGEAHKKLADLHAAKELPAQRAVVDASRLRYQRELVRALRDEGAEVVLDTEAAELASRAKYRGHSRLAPWAVEGSVAPLGPDAFKKGAPVDIVGQMARFAVENSFSVVLSPAHYLGDPDVKDWLTVDRDVCVRLREALDREGGRDIGIDYPLIVPHTDLADAGTRGHLAQQLADLPIENVWIRASGMGSDAGPLTLKRYLSGIGGLHNLGKPIIADHIGGLVGLAAMAFGVVSGVAHGVGERERFDARAWHKPTPERDPDDPFGRAVRVWLPGLNKSLTRAELELLAKARNGRRLVSCGDRSCCPHGLDDMMADPRRHAARQSFKQIDQLQAIPDLRRQHYFLNGPMQEADRSARQLRQLRPVSADAERLKVDSAALMRRLSDHSRKLEKLCGTLEAIHEGRPENAPRISPVVRGGVVVPRKDDRP